MKILKEFEKAYGLAVNLEKSKAMTSKRVSRLKKQRLAAESSISFADNLRKFLGFPLLQGRVKKADFNFLLKKNHAKLSGWKGKLLNKDGKVTLAKAVLTSMPVYNIKTIWIPRAICDEIDRIIRGFLWRKCDTKGLHLVNWGIVKLLKKEGGLGIRRVRENNVAFLAS